MTDGGAEELAACTFNLESLYKRCSCNNECVLAMALLTPALMSLIWGFYHYTIFLVHKLWPELFPSIPGFSLDHEAANASVEDQLLTQQRERTALTLIMQLPSMRWGGPAAAECSLCMEHMERGQVVRRLPVCGHQFHLECIDRWLVVGQRHQSRCCPLCRRDPLARTAHDGGCETLTSELGTHDSIEPWAARRRGSEGELRQIIGAPLRRHSSPWRWPDGGMTTTLVLL